MEPPPSTTPSTKVNCMYGGTPLYQGTVNATCLCPELFHGRECTMANCMNGGTPMPGNLQCQCPPGFQGTNCQRGKNLVISLSAELQAVPTRRS
ncbi:EGF domain protein, partial [Trichostrongylus colubriformis]